MKKMKRRTVAILVAAACVFGMAACSSNKQAEAPVQKAEMNEAGTFPISKERITLTVGVQQNQGIEDWDTNALTKELEEKANVDLQFEVFPAADTASKISARVASQTELPDILALETTPLESYIDTGLFLPTTEYYNDPNMAYYFNKRLESNPEQKEFLLRNAASPDGEIYGVFKYAPEIGNEYSSRMWINKTWLDKLGLPIPTTTEEYYQTLKAFVEQDPNGNGEKDEIGLIGSTNGWNQKPQDTLMNAFTYIDTTYNYLTVQDGQLSVAYTKPEYKEGLEYLNKLVNEGLLSPLTFTQDSSQLKTLAENPDAQMIGSLVAGSLSFYTADSERKKDFVPLPPLTGPNGVCYATYRPSMPGNPTFITKYCENPEVAFRLLDYMYEENMSMWQRFGVPEVDWSTDVEGLKGLYEDSLGVSCGFKQVNDIMGTNNSTYPNIFPAYREMLSPLSMQGIATPENPYDYTVLTANSVQYHLDKHPEEIIERIVYTTDETSQINDILTSINTFRNESVARFIVGDKPFSEWDSYVEELEKIGLEEFIQISQQAYDRTIGK